MNKIIAINNSKIKKRNSQIKKYDINKILNFIDKIYLINLDERKERLKNVLTQFKLYNINNYKRFSAIKPKFDKIDPIIYKNYSTHLSNNKEKYIIGATGCKFSHRDIIKDALNNNYESILIFEDDINFSDNFLIGLNYFINKTSSLDWDMLYLGGRNKKRIDNLCSPTEFSNIYKCNQVKCTHAYMIKRKLFSKILKDLETYDEEIDNYYFKCIQPDYNTYIIYPTIVNQLDFKSDII